METGIAIAVVDDDDDDARQIVGMIDRYYAGDASRYTVTRFADGERFLEDYDARFDLVLLDVQMPGADGMQIAWRLRMIDTNVVLMFTTKVTQYAASGYDVDAIGYLLKPVDFSAFALKMAKAEGLIAARGDVTVALPVEGTTYFLSSRRIHYVEVFDHMLVYHTKDGNLKVWGSLKEAAAQLEPARFVSCSRYCLINPASVTAVDGDSVTVGGARLTVSRSKRRSLMQALVRYHGGMGS